MERRSFVGMGCSVAQCLEVVGDAWTMLIVRDAFAGVTRFDGFQEHLEIPRNTLRDRLNKLVAATVLEKVLYSDHPLRYEYRLTDAGADLWPVLSAMRQWGDRHGATDRAAVRGVHSACHSTTRTITVCETCGVQLGPDDVVLRNLGDPNQLHAATRDQHGLR